MWATILLMNPLDYTLKPIGPFYQLVCCDWSVCNARPTNVLQSAHLEPETGRGNRQQQPLEAGGVCVCVCARVGGWGCRKGAVGLESPSSSPLHQLRYTHWDDAWKYIDGTSERRGGETRGRRWREGEEGGELYSSPWSVCRGQRWEAPASQLGAWGGVRCLHSTSRVVRVGRGRGGESPFPSPLTRRGAEALSALSNWWEGVSIFHCLCQWGMKTHT